MLRRVLFISVLLLPTIALADTAGPNSAGTGADDASTGSLVWTNPSNITASDNTYTTVSTLGTSHYLKGTNFGFSVPAGSTIVGILLEIEQKKGGQESGGGFESAIKIVKADGTIGTESKSTGVQLPTTEAYVSYGSSSNLWSETWTSTDTNDVDFGAVVSLGMLNNSSVLSVDHFRITITYTPAPVPELSPVGLFLLLLACLYVAHREGWLRFAIDRV